MNRNHLLLICALVLVASFGLPRGLEAADDLEVAGWIPYWRASEGARDARKHIDDVDILFPFAFTVKSDGSLSDQANLKSSSWKSLFRSAKSNDVEVIPTVMMSDGTLIHSILSDEDRREAHIEHIVDMVRKGKYDGVDIDYEAKLSATKDYFSEFLTELKEALGSKLLTCTIEARTPPTSLYKTVPTTLEYANDYDVIGDVCDRVEIMAYDQQRADIKLNDARSGVPYIPVSDAAWVEKVVDLTTKTIPNDKIMLGVPTYGHHYEVTVAPNWYQGYRRIGALNVPDMLEVAEDYDVEPGRNNAGEMSFTYFPESSPYKILNSLPTPKGTLKGNEAAAKALYFANATGMTVTVNYATYSDAGAIEAKVDLAKKYDLRGVSLFKIDGEEDREVWNVLN